MSKYLLYSNAPKNYVGPVCESGRFIGTFCCFESLQHRSSAYVLYIVTFAKNVLSGDWSLNCLFDFGAYHVVCLCKPLMIGCWGRSTQYSFSRQGISNDVLGGTVIYFTETLSHASSHTWIYLLILSFAHFLLNYNYPNG